MRAPSEKALRANFGFLGRSGEYHAIRKICASVDDPETFQAIVEGDSPYAQATARYVQQMYSSPYTSAMWRRTVALHMTNTIMGTYGVEALGEGEGPSYAPPYEYLNAGDTYALTLVYKRATDTLSIGSWGDIAERFPNL